MREILTDRTRTVRFWLTNGDSIQGPDESDWPPVTHGSDSNAARNWAELTGLQVTVETRVLTTYAP